MSLDAAEPFLWVPAWYDDSSPRPLGYLAKKDRRTGEIVGKVVPVPISDFPFSVPPKDQVVWRYFDFWKFRDMVANRLLYFRRADSLADKLEGEYARANRKQFTSPFAEFCKAHGLKTTPKEQAKYYRHMKRLVYLSCWHINERESRLMWRSYTTTREAVAVRSTIGKLLSISKRVPGFQVRYDGERVPRIEWLSLAPFVSKRPRFAVENEFRLVLQLATDETHLSSEKGLNVSINPRELFDSVIVHPNATPRFVATVRNFTARAIGGGVRVVRSSIAWCGVKT